MKRMARLVLAAVGVLWGAGVWGGLAPRLLVLEAGSVTASDGTVLQTPEAGTVLRGVAYPVNGGGTMWSFDAYLWGETAPRDVTVRFAGEGGAVSGLGWRGGNGTFGAHAVGTGRGEGRLRGGGRLSPGGNRARRVGGEDDRVVVPHFLGV